MASFFVGVKTTGIFCRPICRAKKPLRKNVEFFPQATDAIAAGYRPCLRCRPMEVSNQMPDWLSELMRTVEADPSRRWKDQDLRDYGVEPARAARWFKANHGITFHGYVRCRRLAGALAQLSIGDDPTQVAFAAGYESLSGFRDAFQKWFGTTPGRINEHSKTLMINRLPTPLGPMVLAAHDDALLLLEFADRRMLQTQIQRLAKRLGCCFCPGENAVIDQTNREIGEYFAGQRQHFDVPIEFPGTDFQKQVWQMLLSIPYGQTSTYEKIASLIGRQGAYRAVGRANGDNRLAIIVPCHRVVRSDGSLCGYGGGLRRKEWMLRLEQANVVGDSV